MILTHENYHTPENKYLSCSKLRDYAKSPEYFYAKHIARTIPPTESDALLRGSMVDTLITQGDEVYEQKFQVVSRRKLKNPPTDYIEVTESQHEEAVEIAKRIKQSQAYKELKKHKRQVVLINDTPIGQFPGIAGMLDFLAVDDSNVAIITDLKTSSILEPKKYFYHALEYGYDMQMAVYEDLVRYNYSHVKTVLHRHLVVETDRDGIHNVAAFEFEQSFVDIGRAKYISLLNTISKDTSFKNEPVSFSTAYLVGDAGVIRRQAKITI